MILRDMCFTALLMTGLMMNGAVVTAKEAPAGAEAVAPAIQLGAPFCDNAVLQRGTDVPVWGWSKPGTKVTVAFAGQKQIAMAGKDGKWMLKFDELKASFEPRKMVITESTGKKVILKNILVGEVWLASGQSNMQHSCTKTTCLKLKVEPVGDAKINPIREFEVKSATAQLHPIEKATGYWKDGEYSGYSAIAFAFAYKLYSELNVPIGILNCSWSQTAIQAWIPRVGYATGDDDYTKTLNLKCLQTDPRTPEHKQVWSAFYKSLEYQITESKALLKKGKQALKIGAAVPGNMSGNRDASWLYNGRLNPVVPYAVKGAIWNQGWANRNEGILYYNNLHSLIRGWRICWNNPEMPVYFHQFYCPDKGIAPSIDGTSEMRLATEMACDIPNSGMASQIDIGGAIHYSNKTVPGRRLALHALKNQYPSTTLRTGEKAKDLVADGPMFKSYKVKGDKVIVDFDRAKGGLVVADTSFNRSREEGATGFADPKVIENGEDKVKLFWLAGADRVWYPATFEIKGDRVVVTSKDVKKPQGISYASGGIGFNACLYNKALLPMTPFIAYDNKMVTSKDWPDEKLKIAGETIDVSSIGKLYEYRKMPILSVQFRDNAVFQAGKPVTIWGSTRLYGEWKDADVEGDCKIHFEFASRLGSGQGAINKTIPVAAGMAEWSVTMPPMKADGKSYTLKASFTIDGELVHERTATNIVFGDVWYIAAPAGIYKAPKKSKRGDEPKPTWKDSGQIVRMIQNHSKRGGQSRQSRFSICVSRTPDNRFAAYWKPASGLAAEIGHRMAAKSKRPVGIIWMQTKATGEKRKEFDQTTISQWMAPSFLKDAPTLMEDYKTVGSQYPDNPYYLANVKRYIADWQGYWTAYIPEMIAAQAVPEVATWGANWGHYPSPQPQIGDSKATYVYNIYVHPFAPAALKGIIFISNESMVKDGAGANFGPEMAALAKSFKAKLGDKDTEFIYTIPTKTLAPKITAPKKIDGKSTAIEVGDWVEVDELIEAAVK